MAMQIGYLESLVAGGFVHETYAPPPGSRPPVVVEHGRPRRRALSLNAVRLLAVSGLVSWSIVAVETWMLVR